MMIIGLKGHRFVLEDLTRPTPISTAPSPPSSNKLAADAEFGQLRSYDWPCRGAVMMTTFVR